MPRQPQRRQCQRCGLWWPATARVCELDGEPLKRQRFRMTPERVRYVHILALSRKGLSDEEYRLRLQAVGVSSSKDLKRDSYNTFVRGLNRLPDSPRWRRPAATRRAA